MRGEWGEGSGTVVGPCPQARREWWVGSERGEGSEGGEGGEGGGGRVWKIVGPCPHTHTHPTAVPPARPSAHERERAHTHTHARTPTYPPVGRRAVIPRVTAGKGAEEVGG